MLFGDKNECHAALGLHSKTGGEIQNDLVYALAPRHEEWPGVSLSRARPCGPVMTPVGRTLATSLRQALCGQQASRTRLAEWRDCAAEGESESLQQTTPHCLLHQCSHTCGGWATPCALHHLPPSFPQVRLVSQAEPQWMLTKSLACFVFQIFVSTVLLNFHPPSPTLELVTCASIQLLLFSQTLTPSSVQCCSSGFVSTAALLGLCNPSEDPALGWFFPLYPAVNYLALFVSCENFPVHSGCQLCENCAGLV